MEKYNKTLVGNDKVLMVHVSQDQDEKAAEDWAAKEGFPWLTILPDDTKRAGLAEYHKRAVVPFYIMIDKDGNEVAQGSGPVFEKAAALGEKDKDA